MNTTMRRRGRGTVEEVWLSQPDPVGSWLDVLMGLIRLPPAERRSIRDELDSHLRDRVRDIMLTGFDEVSATREAIAELGDAAELATRFGRASRAPARRRIAMNIGMLGVACAALVTSVVAIRQPGSGPGPEARMYQAAGAAPSEGATRSIGQFDVQDVQANEAIGHAAKMAGLRSLISNGAMEAIGGAPNGSVTISMSDATLQSVMDEISAQLGVEVEQGRLAYRVREGVLRVATERELDVLERVLVTIDISGAIERDVSSDQICDLIQTFIEPDLWVDNGGDIGEISVVGDKMFVKAPPRMIEGVRWIVGELSHDKASEKQHADARLKQLGYLPERDRIVIQAEDGRLVARVPGKDGEQVFIADQLEFIAPDGTSVGRVTVPLLSDIPLVGQFYSAGSVERGVSMEEVPLPHEKADVALPGEIENQPIDAAPAVAPRQNSIDGTPIGMKMLPLGRTSAESMRAVIGLALNVAPSLRQSPVARTLSLDTRTNSILVSGTSAEIEWMERLIGELDGAGPVADSAVIAEHTFQLQNARAAEVREFLGEALDVNPALKECMVPRIMEVDASDNTLRIAATPGQMDTIGRIVEALDQ